MSGSGASNARAKAGAIRIWASAALSRYLELAMSRQPRPPVPPSRRARDSVSSEPGPRAGASRAVRLPDPAPRYREQPMSDTEGPGGLLEVSPPPGVPWAWPMRGQLVEMVLHSRLLQGNPLGDPADRPLWVYLPPGYADQPERRLPVIYLLQGLSGQLDMWKSRSGFR